MIDATITVSLGEGAIFGGHLKPTVKYRSYAASTLQIRTSIEVAFGARSPVGRGNHVVVGGAHGRHLANTSESFRRGGDAVLCRITLTTCLLLVPCVGLGSLSVSALTHFVVSK